jgi:hypothetical protein
MRKTFALSQPGKADARVLDAIKHDVRKYVKRERRKPLPPGFDTWDFSCKVGTGEADAQSTLLGQVSAAIDSAASTGATSVFIEITAIPSRRDSPAQSRARAPFPTDSVPPPHTS